MRFTVNTKINQDSNFLFTSTFELKFDTNSRVALEPVGGSNLAYLISKGNFKLVLNSS